MWFVKISTHSYTIVKQNRFQRQSIVFAMHCFFFVNLITVCIMKCGAVQKSYLGFLFFEVQITALSCSDLLAYSYKHYDSLLFIQVSGDNEHRNIF